MIDAGAANHLTAEDRLSFYALAEDGSIHLRDLARFMERTGLTWWRQVTGIERQAFWDEAKATLVVHHVRITQGPATLATGAEVLLEHRIQHGRRERPGRRPEYGFVDTLQIRVLPDGALAGQYQAHSVWIDLREGFSVAAAPPAGLAHLDEDLPAIAAFPQGPAGDEVARFRWTLRESDPNGHVALLSYLDRAENALSDSAVPTPLPRVWQAWFRQPSFAGEEMQTWLRPAADGATIRIAGAGDGRTRALIHLRHGRRGGDADGPD